MELAHPTLTAYLASPLEVGEPDVAGPLAVFPLFGSPAQFVYQSFAQGRGHGVTIKELGAGASVRDLVIQNPTDIPVLLFEGEEVLGAQQNRTFDVSVLVGAGMTLQVPVSCVEAGRWDGSRHSESFEPAPQAAYPKLRRQKNRAVLAQVVSGAEARADQSAVWAEVDEKLDTVGASAPTRAMHDGYEQRRRDLRTLTDACRLRDGQVGALVAIGGELTVLDLVSRPDVFASLFEPLVQGYALDALAGGDAEAPDDGVARAFLDRVVDAPILERDAIGLGRDVRLSGTLHGAGLVRGDELVQLSVFAPESSPGPAPGGRIRRPSRRRTA